jgi:peptide/nickel transport system permease protein
MFRYLIRRLLGALLVVIIVSMVTFGIFFIGPKVSGTSPAYFYVGKVSTPAQVAAVEKNLGLDRPIAEQYWKYMKGIVVGREGFTDGTSPATEYCSAPCFGYSFRLFTPVSELMAEAFPVTLSLAIGASIMWLLAGVSIGVLSALKRGSFLDRSAMVIALAGVSLPVFFTGQMLLLIFSYGPAWLQLFPNVTWVPFSENPALWAQNLILPWVSLAFLFAALYARFTRANMLETMSEDYIRTATAKGLKHRTVVSRHGLRAALTPIVTIFGLDVGALLGGAILTETTFSLPGLGLLSYRAIQSQDLPVILGVTIVAATFIVIANIVVDVLYAFVDPRVRLS